MEEGRILPWDLATVTFEDPSHAPFSGGSSVTLALLIFEVLVQALAHPGPSTIGVPEQKVAAMLEARRLPRGWVGKVNGRIYREFYPWI